MRYEAAAAASAIACLLPDSATLTRVTTAPLMQSSTPLPSLPQSNDNRAER